MKKGSAKRVSSLPSTAEFNLGGLYHALRIATVRSSDSLWVPFDKEGKCCKVIHSPTQPQYIETICCLLYTNDELNTSLRIDPSRASRLVSNTAHVPDYFTNKFLADNIFETFSLNVRDRFLSRFTNEQHEFFRQLLVELIQKIPKNSESAYLASNLPPEYSTDLNANNEKYFFSYATNSTMPGGVLVVDNRLLVIQTLATEKSTPHIDVMDSTGNLIKQIQGFQASQILPGSFTSDYYTDGENLYFTLSNVDSDTATTVCQLVRVSLTDGSIAILKEFSNDTLQVNIVAADSRNLIYRKVEGKSVRDIQFTYFALDVDTQSETALELTMDNMHGLEFCGKEIYIYDYEEQKILVQTLSLTTLYEVSTTNLENSVIAAHGNIQSKLMFPLPFDTKYCLVGYKYLTSTNEYQTCYYLLDNDTGEFCEFTLLKAYNESPIDILAITEEGLAVRVDWVSANPSMPDMLTEELAILAPEDYLSSVPNYINVAKLCL